MFSCRSTEGRGLGLIGISALPGKSTYKGSEFKGAHGILLRGQEVSENQKHIYREKTKMSMDLILRHKELL